MKTEELQLAVSFTCHPERKLYDAFKIYNEGVEEYLTKKDWVAQEEKPVGKEYFKLGGKFWTNSNPNFVPENTGKCKDKSKREKLLEAKIKELTLKSNKSKFNFFSNKLLYLQDKYYKTRKFLYVISGPKVSDEEFKRRLAICYECKFKISKGNNKIYCKPCGCGTHSQAELHNKLKWARTKCPKKNF